MQSEESETRMYSNENLLENNLEGESIIFQVWVSLF